MNLQAVTAPLVGAINVPETITISPSTGYTTNATGKQVPTYGAPVSVSAQVQELSQRDIYQTQNLNIQGVQVTAYLPGAWSGVVRADRKGGDLVTRADGSILLVVAVLEAFKGWTKVLLTLQNGS